ncbi:MAG: hypothetical protein KTR24_17910 [Saprospiraceae bacterium]|nr:hypothetical protein [Saprospiraceae bacterium]
MEIVKIGGESFFKIPEVTRMRPFFMTIVSATNHWLFVSSNGGISAGRKTADGALFPYYTDDKITESTEITGAKSIFRLHHDGTSHLWEPFSIRQHGRYAVSRHLYKNIQGSKVLFEEINHELQLSFRYQWSTSDAFGFVRSACLTNLRDDAITIEVLDGLQNILPAGVNSALQQNASNLVDAYKRSELVVPVGLGIYALSAVIVDKAEPSEALRANTCWSIGLSSNPIHLLSSKQLDSFRNGGDIVQEYDVKAERGAYFISAQLSLAAEQTKEWTIVADVNKNHSAIAETIALLKENNQIQESIQSEVANGERQLLEMVAASDGIQCTSDKLKDARHFSNCLFNIMRGGIFDNNYSIDREDLASYLTQANSNITIDAIAALPATCTLSDIRAVCSATSDPDLKRLLQEYLPLRFSRRHGDPSRPWNRFSINTQSELDGKKILDFEGNWRDIFQNWEALVQSYPEFIDGIIFKFLNASTADGYNPYRITKGGIDWEISEPDDPWAYIGYWGDHQIIYLLKLLEHAENYYPGKLSRYMAQDIFVYANVPYRIKPYDSILADPKNTVDFDHASDQHIRKRMEAFGSDAALLTYADGSIVRANFMEKILVTLLTKISNFIPEGGIWMNTQRPEWNDANNALVGNGVSMVTLCYLNRFLRFLPTLLDSENQRIDLSIDVSRSLSNTMNVLVSYQYSLDGRIDDTLRKQILDGLGKAGSEYRHNLYRHSLKKEKESVAYQDLHDFSTLMQSYTSHAIRANRRKDGLYHSYNLMTVEANTRIVLNRLSPMLEGQVAVLSAQQLSPKLSLETLEALKRSDLYRSDQSSYLLYPNKQLPGFLQKNIIPPQYAESSTLIKRLLAIGNREIVEQDIDGILHFNADFKNVEALRAKLSALSHSTAHDITAQEQAELEGIFEHVFKHKYFTGRSGTFYGYEGLGSIYWHMVSKLLLAVHECIVHASKIDDSTSTLDALIDHFHAINAGIGLHKSPSLYGAFPTDPYSHTPAGRGAQQPGMTGQVKEDILSRFGELGITISDGKIHFNPIILSGSEFLASPKKFSYLDVHGNRKEISLNKGSLAFTFCQIPILYAASDKDCVTIEIDDGSSTKIMGKQLDQALSQAVFSRSGLVIKITVELNFQ